MKKSLLFIILLSASAVAQLTTIAPVLPASLRMSNWYVGQMSPETQEVPFWIVNPSGTGLTISISTLVLPKGMNALDNYCSGNTLTPGQYCYISLQYKPNRQGYIVVGRLVLNATDQNSNDVSLKMVVIGYGCDKALSQADCQAATDY